MGYRPGRQCLGIASYLNDRLAKADGWKLPAAMISMDIDIAFDNIKPEVAAEVLSKGGGSAQLVCSQVRERTGLSANLSLACRKAGPVLYMQKAKPKTHARTANPGGTWNALVAAALEPLDTKWRNYGTQCIDWGPCGTGPLAEHATLVLAGSIFLFTAEATASCRQVPGIIGSFG